MKIRCISFERMVNHPSFKREKSRWYLYSLANAYEKRLQYLSKIIEPIGVIMLSYNLMPIDKEFIEEVVDES